MNEETEVQKCNSGGEDIVQKLQCPARQIKPTAMVWQRNQTRTQD